MEPTPTTKAGERTQNRAVTVFKSVDPKWPKFGVANIEKDTRWFNTEREAMEFAYQSVAQDEAIIARGDVSVRPRIRKELQIIRRLLADLRAGGFSLAVDDGGARISGSDMELIETIFGVDESHILASKDGKRSFVFLVMGNGDDVISDYSVSLESVIEPVSTWIEEMQERGE